MSFGQPDFLWLWLLVPVLGLGALRGRRLRARAWYRLAQRGNVPSNRTFSMLGALILLILAVVLVIFGIAGRLEKHLLRWN